MLRRRRMGAFGLRGRIVGAVLVATVATLVVAALALLSPLEHSLRTAAQRTLQTDLRKASGTVGTLRRLTTEHVQGVKVGGRLVFPNVTAQVDAAQDTLQTKVGATSVVVIAYVDVTGHGHPVGAVRRDQAAAVATGHPDVATALRRKGTVYSFPTVGPRNYVRAAISLGSDAVLTVRKSIDEIPGAVRTIRNAFVVAALAGLLLTALLAIPLAATLVRRLQRLRESALQLAAGGDVPDLPPDRSRDEVGDLSRAFSIMQRRLGHQEEARRVFVSTASHELRTPLASLDVMLELLADDLRSGEQLDLDDAHALLERARIQSRRLGRLAADLLDLSRIDADVQLRSEPVELGELCRAVLAEFELTAGEREVRSVLHERSGPVWALGDPGSIARILRILLDNALRVAPRRSEIGVVLSGGTLPTLSVVDHGPGVARDERDVIFDRFKRGRDTGGEAGFGLGLAIGRELAERMGGSLVLGDGDVPGATFTLTLRAAEAPVEEGVATAVTP